MRLPRALLAALLFSAAGAASAQGFPLRVTDDTGASLTLTAPPVRIVSLTIATDEILLRLVDPKRIIGITTYGADPKSSNVADAAAAVPNKLTLNVEKVLSLSPDLVLVADWSDAGVVQQLRAAGLPVYLMAGGLTVTSIEQKIRRLAELCGAPEAGRAMVADMEKRLAAVSRRVASVPAQKRPKVMNYGTWGGAMGRGSSWDEILQRAGLVNAVADLKTDSWGQVPLSKEEILVLDPDVLVLPGWENARQVTQDPAFAGLRAVKTGRVYEMPQRLDATTSQYIVDAVEWLARTAYPGLFP